MKCLRRHLIKLDKPQINSVGLGCQTNLGHLMLFEAISLFGTKTADATPPTQDIKRKSRDVGWEFRAYFLRNM